MGGLITFELVRQLRRDKFPEPVHIFVSGYRAPQLPDLDAPIHNLPDAEFIKELQKLGGTPKDILLHPELVELLIPIIRNDVMLCETYVYREEEPLRCSISAFGGLKDNKLNRSQIEAWNKQTNGAFEMKMFKSDHFFLQENKDSLLREISNKLDHLKNIYFYEKRIDH